MSSSLFPPLLALLVATPLQAEETLALDRFSVSIGEYQTNLTAEASVKRAGAEARTREYGASTGPALAFFELGYRPFERHSFRAAWFDHDRSTTRTLSDDVEFGDASYPVGATLVGNLAVKVLEVDYTYWAWLSRRNAFGPVVGIV